MSCSYTLILCNVVAGTCGRTGDTCVIHFNHTGPLPQLSSGQNGNLVQCPSEKSIVHNIYRGKGKSNGQGKIED